MALAYLSNYFPSLTETFIYREVIELARRGIDVSIYSLRRPDAGTISGESRELAACAFYLLPVPLPRVAVSHLRAFLRRPVRYAAALAKMVLGSHWSARDRLRSLMHFGEGVVLAERMAADGIDHIHAHFASQSASVARVIHLLTGIPYSFTGHAHDIWQDRLLLPEKLDEAVFAATCSVKARSALIAEGRTDVSSKVHLVYHGLDLQNFPYCNGEERERNLILSVGRLTVTKGFPDLIAACALLRDAAFPFRCLIVGEGEDRKALEGLIEAAGLSGMVSLAGAVPQERIRAYYRQAWVFVLPCVDSPDGNRDGIPNVLMEAMACGVPVVTTSNSGQGELIENGVDGILVETHSPAAVAKAILSLCGNDSLHERLARAARRRIAEDFDNRKTIEPLVELFRRFVPQHRLMDGALERKSPVPSP